MLDSQASPAAAPAGERAGARRFQFDRDSVSFPNELVWMYHFEDATRTWKIGWRRPRPVYSHRCFVLARLVHLFARHAEFRPDFPPPGEETLRTLIRSVLARDPRSSSSPGDRVVIGGGPGLRDLSQRHEGLLKNLAGGAWRSYFLRSHWRMVFPISRRHQALTMQSLVKGVAAGDTRVIHLVQFPRLTINHCMVVYEAVAEDFGWQFLAYDPNDVSRPVALLYTDGDRCFRLGANPYWPGGRLNVIEIFRTPWL